MKPVPAWSWDDIDSLREAGGLTEDAEGFTVRDYASRYGITRAAAQPQLERMVAAGNLLKGYRRVVLGGVTRRVAVYRPA